MDSNKKKHLQKLLVKRTRYIAAVRRIRKKTQQQMADILGISRPTYNKEENSSQISTLFYLAIGSYWDSCYKEILEKWRKKPTDKENRKMFYEWTALLNPDNYYRIKNIPKDDFLKEDDYVYFHNYSFNQEWWDIITKGSYNELDDLKLKKLVEKGSVFIDIDELDVDELDKFFNKMSKIMRRYNKKIYILTSNKDFEIDNLSEVKIKESLSENDKILSVLLKNRPYIDFSFSKLNYKETINKMIKVLKAPLMIVENKINILNDVRITTNRKAKNVFKKIFKGNKNSLYQIGYFNDILLLYVKWENDKFIYNDLYYDDVYKEIPDDAILAYVIFALSWVIHDLPLEEQNRIENILKEEFPEYIDSLKENINNIMMKYIGVSIP